MKIKARILAAGAALALIAGCTPAAGALADAPTEWHARVTCTTDSAGRCTQTFAHPLGVVPVLHVDPDNLTAITHPYQATADSFRVRVMQTTTTPWANRTVTLNVSAFAPTPAVPPATTAPPTVTPTTLAPTSPPPTTAPPETEFPDASNTGPTGPLTVVNGDQAYRTAGQVVENVEIRASNLYVAANNVTFRNCKIVYTGALDAQFTLVNIISGVSGTRFETCELDGQSKVSRAIKGIDGVYVSGTEIHHTGNAVEVSDKVTVVNSYLHDIVSAPGTDWHADGIQTRDGSASDILIQHNTILLTGGETGAVYVLGAAGDTLTNVLVDNNLMAGGSYTVYLGAGTLNNVRATNNHFSTRYWPKVGQYGIWYGSGNVTRTGNVIHETGAPVNS